jgi:TonB family protein
MSYDLQIWSVGSFDSASLPAPGQWQHHAETQWVRAGDTWQISVFRSDKVFPEDVPEEIAKLLPGIQYLTTIDLEGKRTNVAERLLRTTSNAIAKSLHGVVFDPQEDTIRTPAGVKRFSVPPRQESFSVLRMSWWFLESPLLSHDGLRSFLELLEKFLPEAMPRRYGLYEPPQHIFAETGKAHLLQFMLEQTHQMVVWYPNRPVVSFYLGQPKTVGASRAGFRTNVLDIEIESTALSQPGWSSNLFNFWRHVSNMLKPLYGEVRTHHGYERRGSTVFPSMKNHSCLNVSWWWRGVPKLLGSAVVLGKEYQELWPSFLPQATLESGLAFANYEDWNSQKDLSDKIGVPPRPLLLRGESAYGGDQEYPDVWPFGEPFDPPRPPARGTFMRKIRNLFGAGMLAIMFFFIFGLYVLPAPAQVAVQLKATPKTLDWGYYNAKTTPVLREKSGDTDEIQTPAAVLPAQEEKRPIIYVKHLVPPYYPPLAHMTRISGTVVMKLKIDSDGKVISVETVGHDLLKKDAEKNIRTWTFGCAGCPPDAPFEHTIRFKYVQDNTLPERSTKTVMDLPDEVTMSAGPIPVEPATTSKKRSQ